MAASPFLPQPPSFRPTVTAQSAFPPSLSVASTAANQIDRDQPSAMSVPFGFPAHPPVTWVLIRRLPRDSTEGSLRLMLVFSKELGDVEVLPESKSQDPGFVCAKLSFKSLAGAQEAKNMLDGKPNISNDALMIVDILNGSPGSRARHLGDAPVAAPIPVPAPASAASSSAASSATSSRQPSRFNGAFGALETVSPPMNSVYASDLSIPEASTHFQSIFSPQSPIGNHLTERARVSGKTLIKNDAADDDETGELLKDPLAYAENGAMGAQARRATAPQIPISRMTGLSLNTNNHTMPAYGNAAMGPISAHSSTMSPTLINAAGPAMNYMANHSFTNPRHNFPPVNPADQNPPCNTLYVGNLPIDTSEEELKATFSKQRGYKRLCFRTKQNGPMCFVEFEDVSFATKALHDLYGHMLHNSVKGGIRLSFSKNPLGVRSGQNPAQNSPTPMASINSIMAGSGTVFSTVNGPPPGLSAPPGLGMNRSAFSPPTPSTAGGNSSTFPPPSRNSWNTPAYGNTMTAGGPSTLANGTPNAYPAYMLGR